MGEYAIRKSDGAEIKIGTCEDMYYLRFSDRHLVSALPGSVDVNDPEMAGLLRYRLPFPDEDNEKPGDYHKHGYSRGLRLWRKVGDSCEDFKYDEVSEPGNIQLKHECGLLLNVPCYHGAKLPDIPGAFWNGKSWFLELAQLRAVYQGGELRVFPVVHCRFCRGVWRHDWSEVWEYLQTDMRERLAVYSGLEVSA